MKKLIQFRVLQRTIRSIDKKVWQHTRVFFLRKTVNTVNILKAMFRFGVVRFGVFTDVIFEELMLTNKVGKLENFSTILKLNPKAN